MTNFCDCNNNIKKKRNIGLFRNYTTDKWTKWDWQWEQYSLILV